MTQTILLVDDEPTITDIVERYLTRDDYRVLTAHDGAEALQLFNTATIDLIVTDIMMPEMDGYDFILQVLDENPDVSFLFITAKTQEADRLYGLTLGADDYVMKPFSPRELVLRIKNILHRVSNNKMNEIKVGALTIDDEKRTATLYGSDLNLTMKEFDLLFILANDTNKVFSKSELFGRVWGVDYLEDANTMNVHIHRLREKLEKAARDRDYPVIETVWGMGYKLAVEQAWK